MEPEEFIEEIVKKWMYHDIGVAIKGEANFLAALGLMAYTEIIGGLLNGKLRGEIVENKKGEREKQSRSKENFERCIVDLFPDEYKKQVYIINTFYEKVRSGLVHEYFIKEGDDNPTTKYLNDIGKIENNPKDEDGREEYGLSCAVVINNNRVVFYVNQYFKDFKYAVENYSKKVKNSKEIQNKFYSIFPKSSTDIEMFTSTSGDVVTRTRIHSSK